MSSRTLVMPTVVVFLVIASVCSLVYYAGNSQSERLSVDVKHNGQPAATARLEDSLESGLTADVMYCGVIAVLLGLAFLLTGTLRAGGSRFHRQSVLHCLLAVGVVFMVVSVVGNGR